MVYDVVIEMFSVNLLCAQRIISAANKHIIDIMKIVRHSGLLIRQFGQLAHWSLISFF